MLLNNVGMCSYRAYVGMEYLCMIVSVRKGVGRGRDREKREGGGGGKREKCEMMGGGG